MGESRLSPEEQQILEALERDFNKGKTPLLTQRILWILVVVAGLVALISGSVLGNTPGLVVGLGGFLLMFGGSIKALEGW